MASIRYQLIFSSITASTFLNNIVCDARRSVLLIADRKQVASSLVQVVLSVIVHVGPLRVVWLSWFGRLYRCTSSRHRASTLNALSVISHFKLEFIILICGRIMFTGGVSLLDSGRNWIQHTLTRFLLLWSIILDPVADLSSLLIFGKVLILWMVLTLRAIHLILSLIMLTIARK